MREPGKKRLTQGIVNAAVGLLALMGIGQAKNMIIPYLIVCLGLMVVGGLLIRTYVVSMRKYGAWQKEQQERAEKEEMLRQKRMLLEQERIDAELEKLQAEEDGTKVCPSCGAVTRGYVCEYCGAALTNR